MGILSSFVKDMGIDLGTANTLVYIKGKGIVAREPSVVAIDKTTNNVLAVGYEAKKMVGRTPANIITIRPLRDGVIADFDITRSMLKHFIRKATRRRTLFQPRVVVCIPSGITEVEKKAVEEATIHAGSREVFLIEEPMAAAIGTGLPIQDPTGSMIVDIGGGTTEVAIISLGGVVASKSIRVGGDELDESIITYIKKKYNILIGETTAEEIKIKIGTVDENAEEKKMEITGRDFVSGLPKTHIISSGEVYEAMKYPIFNIIEAIKSTLEKTPPELASDVMEYGIMLTGGGALLSSLNEFIEAETGIPVQIADEPLNCVAVGTGQALENIDMFKKASNQNKRMR